MARRPGNGWSGGEVALVWALPVPAALIGDDGRLAAANAEAEALFGPDLAGRPWIAAFRQPVLLDCIETSMRLNERASATYLTRTQGRETTWHATATPVAGMPQEVGRGGQTLVTFEDRTAMQEAGQQRRDFVANVSHELRTPLTALLGFIETLKGAAKDDAAARDRFLSIMEREAGRMNRLIDDLLSLGRVESEERVRPTGRVDLSGVLDSVALALRPLAEARQATLAVAGAAEPVLVQGDADQLAQVFTNLAENAIKYGGPGIRVDLRLDRAGTDPALRGPAVRATVEDDGAGIDPVHIPRLTERFYRVDGHRSREVGGTGLGLAIVKHIVNRHRGRLRIESAPGQGTRITVTLPAAPDQG